MRPIERGTAPTDASGNAIAFKAYGEAREPLIRRIGYYCSYCEIVIPSGPDIEHVLPKVHHPGRALDWDNFLFGCRNCNSIKQDKPVVLTDFYWPDVDNTFRPFDHSLDSPPRPAGHLTATQKQKAQQTLDLTGLDRVPGPPDIARGICAGCNVERFGALPLIA